MDFEKRIAELFVEIPDLKETVGPVVGAVQTGKLLVTGLHLAISAGKVGVKGRLGVEVSPDKGRLAARYALLEALGGVRAALGSLNKVKRIVRLEGFVASGPEFTDQEKIFADASQLLADIFGKSGHHALTAVGVPSLPKGSAVGVALLVETHDTGRVIG